MYSELNTLPDCASVNASPGQLPLPRHHSRPRKLARFYFVRLFHSQLSSGLCRRTLTPLPVPIWKSRARKQRHPVRARSQELSKKTFRVPVALSDGAPGRSTIGRGITRRCRRPARVAPVRGSSAWSSGAFTGSEQPGSPKNGSRITPLRDTIRRSCPKTVTTMERSEAGRRCSGSAALTGGVSSLRYSKPRPKPSTPTARGNRNRAKTTARTVTSRHIDGRTAANRPRPDLSVDQR
jgi:hypothetical protein